MNFTEDKVYKKNANQCRPAQEIIFYLMNTNRFVLPVDVNL